MEKQLVDLEKLQGNEQGFTGDELAKLLGIQKNPNAGNGQPPIMVTNGLLVDLFNQLIAQHEKAKRKALGLKDKRVQIPRMVINTPLRGRN